MKKKFFCWADTMELKEIKVLRVAQYINFIIILIDILIFNN